MSDKLFEQLKRVLDDGLILTPDIELSIRAFFVDAVGIQSLMANDQVVKLLAGSAAYYGMVKAQNEFYRNVPEVTFDQRTALSISSGVQVGIMLGLLAAERMKTEVSK